MGARERANYRLVALMCNYPAVHALSLLIFIDTRFYSPCQAIDRIQPAFQHAPYLLRYG